MKRNKDALKNALPRLSVTFYKYDLNQTVMLHQRRIPFQTYKLKQKYELSIFFKIWIFPVTQNLKMCVCVLKLSYLWLMR